MHNRAMQYLAFLQTREEQITVLAYLRWLMRGCPEGSPQVDWFAAESDFDRQFVAQLELGIPA
jgi:hypothetical protein